MRYLLRSVTLIVAAILVASGGCAATRIPPAGVADVANIQIENFGQVDANYYRGGAPRDRDYAALAALGVRTVINLRPERDDEGSAQVVAEAGMAFYRIPMSSRATPTPEQVSEFLTLVTDPARQPVFVHCSGGRHRTGAMTAIYRMEHDGWTADQAFREMKRYKFGLERLHPELRDFVRRYQPLRTHESRTRK